MLSDEQMCAVSGAGISDWEEVNRPVGPQPIPDWCRGAHVEWMNGVANAPTVSIKAAGDLYQWPDQQWVKEGAKMYIARHPDGRARVLYHDGRTAPAGAWRVMRDGKQETYDWFIAEPPAGESPDQAARRAGKAHLDQVRRRQSDAPDGRVLEVKFVLATTQQHGFGGSNYFLKMADGTELVLRGPWHCGAPAGYVEVGVVDITGKYFDNSRRDRDRPWHQRMGGPSVYLTEELFLRIMARYCAHAPVARVKHTYGSRLEPFRAEWGAPKSMIYDLEHGRACRKEPAGEFWRVYWDGTGRYCGNLRIPTHGFQEGVTV